METVTSALCALLQAQPVLADQIPALGHIPRLCSKMAMKTNQISVHKSAILVLHQLALSENCINAISQTDCMSPLKNAMQSRRDMIGVACEALNRLFSTNQEQLVKQALQVDFVTYLLSLLESQLDIENQAMTKAQIVSALKSMARSLLYGPKVNALLDKSSVWAEFRDQRHDLFISNTPIAGYLTGKVGSRFYKRWVLISFFFFVAGTPANAGYLTAGPTSNTISTVPPPVDKDDPLASRTELI